jgi:hypothetical protein
LCHNFTYICFIQNQNADAKHISLQDLQSSAANSAESVANSCGVCSIVLSSRRQMCKALALSVPPLCQGTLWGGGGGGGGLLFAPVRAPQTLAWMPPPPPPALAARDDQICSSLTQIRQSHGHLDLLHNVMVAGGSGCRGCIRSSLRHCHQPCAHLLVSSPAVWSSCCHRRAAVRQTPVVDGTTPPPPYLRWQWGRRRRPSFRSVVSSHATARASCAA